jgi:hypothetical protein
MSAPGAPSSPIAMPPVTPAPAAAWWPLTRKVGSALAAYLTAEGAAFVGELTTGVPGWALIGAGAIPGGIALAVAYLTRDTSSPVAAP